MGNANSCCDIDCFVCWFFFSWKADTYVGSVFLSVPDGTICYASINCLGSWHDALVAQRLLPILLLLPLEVKACADTAFPHSQKFAGVILTPLKDDERQRAHRSLSPDAYVELLERNLQVIRIRVGSEWTNHSVSSCFARLQLPLPADRHAYRSNVIETCIRLHNFRTNVTGLGEVRKYYSLQWLKSEVDVAVCPVKQFYRLVNLFPMNDDDGSNY